MGDEYPTSDKPSSAAHSAGESGLTNPVDRAGADPVTLERVGAIEQDNADREEASDDGDESDDEG
jgi:hypothetical protein